MLFVGVLYTAKLDKKSRMMKEYELNENRLLVFGGPYSNLEATKKMKKIVDKLGFAPEQVVCTGDVVGYCANPEETVQLIRDWGIQVIAGNVELQLMSGEDDCGCNFEEGSRCDLFSRNWFPFAQRNLSTDSIDWMATLPTALYLKYEGHTALVCHGSPDNTSEFVFNSTPEEDKRKWVEQAAVDMVLAGHSGIPFSQNLLNGKNWSNAGVIGMPANDRTTRVWFAIIDLKSLTTQLHAFEYDHLTTYEKMIEKKLPTSYAKTLKTGIWDNCEILPDQETREQGINLEAYVDWK